MDQPVGSSLADHVDPDAHDLKSFTSLLNGTSAGSSTPTVSDPGMNMTASSKTLQRTSSCLGGSFAERLAARVGAEAINSSRVAQELSNHQYEYKPDISSADRMKHLPPSRIPIPPLDCFTIPAGLSPTTLLDSPVLFSSYQAEPSPTTGTLRAPSGFKGSGFQMSSSSESNSKESGSEPEQEGSSAFVFKPLRKQGSTVSSSKSIGNPVHFGMMHQCTTPTYEKLDIDSSGPVVTSTSLKTPSLPPRMMSLAGRHQQLASADRIYEEPHVSAERVPIVVERPSEDGYNWRKYGQKQVKGSEYPRSYYKCTAANCPVKKKVERSLDGQVTEIVYKGEHNHSKPQPSRRMAMGSVHAISVGVGRDSQLFSDTVGEREGDHGGAFKGNLIQGSSGWDNFGMSSKGQAFERGPTGYYLDSASGAPKFSAESGGNVEPSTSSYSDDDEQGSKFSTEDGDGPDSKRRRRENLLATETVGVQRTIREPRVVVQTTSDIDILDDGYRWRKYGQKVVKGNPHPRSYYKCTNVGCPVRKHVERASQDPKSVITTYEGKHNHDVPVGKGSNQDARFNNVSPSTIEMAPSDDGLNLNASIFDEGSQFNNKTTEFEMLFEDDPRKMGMNFSDMDLGIGIKTSKEMFNTDMSSMTGKKEDFPFSTTTFMGLADSIESSLHSNRIERYDSAFSSSNVQDSLVVHPKQEYEDDSFHPFHGTPSIFHHNISPKLVLGP